MNTWLYSVVVIWLYTVSGICIYRHIYIVDIYLKRLECFLMLIYLLRNVNAVMNNPVPGCIMSIPPTLLYVRYIRLLNGKYS